MCQRGGSDLQLSPACRGKVARRRYRKAESTHNDVENAETIMHPDHLAYFKDLLEGRATISGMRGSNATRAGFLRSFRVWISFN